MRKYHVCYGTEKDETCIKRFLNEMKKQFGIKIEWIKNKKDKKDKLEKDKKDKINYYSLGQWKLTSTEFNLCKS